MVHLCDAENVEEILANGLHADHRAQYGWYSSSPGLVYLTTSERAINIQSSAWGEAKVALSIDCVDLTTWAADEDAIESGLNRRDPLVECFRRSLRQSFDAGHSLGWWAFHHREILSRDEWIEYSLQTHGTIACASEIKADKISMAR